MKRIRFFLLFFLAYSFVHAQEYRLGFLLDFEINPRSKRIVNEIKNEIQKTVGGRKTISLSDTRIVSCNWNSELAKEKYLQLAQESDLIILLGGTSVTGALKSQPFAIPTLAIGVIDPELLSVPLTPKQSSGIPNFSYILNSPDLTAELQALSELQEFKHLVILVDNKTTGLMDRSAGNRRIEALKTEFGAEIDILPITDDISASLNAIPAGADAVYVAIPYERTIEEIKQIADGLIAKKLPSFAMNKRHVDAGMLACLSDENGFQQIIRKLSIMADDVLSGQKLGDMSVKLNEKNELFFNAPTARKIGLAPSFETIFTANIVGSEEDNTGPKLSLQRIIAISLEENLNIKSSEQDIRLTEMDIKFAKSNFLPDASLSLNGSQVSKNITNPLTGQAQRSIGGQANVQQLIYSEQAIAGITISKYLNEAQDYATKQVINDLIYDSFLAYFAILKSKTAISIQKENLSVSQKNLELAEIRAKVGYSSNADIYRWQSEVATAKQQVIEAYTNLSLAKMQLSVYLNGKIDEEFDIADATLEDSTFLGLSDSGIGEFINGPVEFKKLSRFLIGEAQERFPTKMQLMSNSKVLERQNKLYKRLYYLPTVSAVGQVNSTMLRGGLAAEPLPGNQYVNNHWNVALSLSYPIFNRNSRKLNLETTAIQRLQLDYQINSLDQNLRLGVTSRALQLLTAQTNINFSRTSAENISKSFDLIQQAYKQGQASVTQLVDAQRAKIQAQQAYALSLYEYMEAFIGLENQIGSYTSLSTPEENQALKQRITEFVIDSQND